MTWPSPTCLLLAGPQPRRFTRPDPVLAGGYVAGIATANISNTVISYDRPSNTWMTACRICRENARA